MKKTFKAAAVVLVLLLALAALFACVQKGEVSGDSMTIVLDDQNSDPVVIQVDLNAMSYNEETGLMNVLQSLRLQENQIVVVGNGSANVVCGHGNVVKKGQRFISNSGIASSVVSLTPKQRPISLRLTKRAGGTSPTVLKSISS